MVCNIDWMGHQCTQVCRCKWEHDFLHHILHWHRIILDKDPGIFCWCMLCQLGSQHWQHILVYSLVGNQSCQAGTCIDIYLLHFLVGCCLDHKDLGHRDHLLQLVQLLKSKIDLKNKHACWYLRIGFSLHAVKGSPMYPSLQVQVGMWFWTLQFAFTPQVPGQGSMQWSCWHALFDGQSELTTHSGLQAT